MASDVAHSGKEGTKSASSDVPLRILVVDDHPAIRQGIIALIHTEGDLTVCGEAETFREALAKARELEPDIVLLDINLPDTNGFELIRVLKTEFPDLPMLVVSVHEETRFALRALQAGASGYIRKADAAGDVLEGVRRVLGGEIFLSQKFANEMIFQITSSGNGRPSPVERLSPREREVLELLGGGRTTREIGRQLNISVKTVETHRGHMKEKLNLGSSNELTRFALDWAVQNEDPLDGQGEMTFPSQPTRSGP